MTSSVAAPDSALEARLGQIADEFTQRSQRGEQPDIEEYARNNPEIATVLRQVLAALQVMGSAERDPSSLEAGLAAAPAAGCLGDFRILREVGRGGMGIVYEAEQISLNRRVALKVLPFASTLDAKQLQRFKNEAQAAAGLHHTNIVPVYATGCERGVHFYAMQFIEGRTLAAVVEDLRAQVQRQRPTKGVQTTPWEKGPELHDEPAASPESPAHDSWATAPGPLAPTRSDEKSKPASPQFGISTDTSTKNPAYFRTVAQLGIQAAQALEHAHQLGVVHRDIKPANLLIEHSPLSAQESPRLWITDFGLAQVQSNASLTLTGDLVGTIRYMSPEQTLAKRVLLDHRTDIYSLGVTLYELLTLEPAFTGRNRHEVVHQIAFEEPRRPRQINKAIPEELETIILKTLEKNPAERYATAQELAEDLERFLKDEPIRAKRPTVVQRVRKWGRRHKPVVISAAAVVLFVLAAAPVTTLLIWRQWSRAEKAYEQEVVERKRADDNLALAFQTLDEIYLGVAGEGLPRDPRLEKEHLALLRKSLRFFEQFAEANHAQPNAQHEAGRAYLRVGNIQRLLGKHAEAETAYDQAVTLLEKVASDFPAWTPGRQWLAAAYNALGTFYIDGRRFPDAEKALRESVKLRQRLADLEPDSADFQSDLAASQANLAIVFRRTGRGTDAENLWETSVAILKKLVDQYPRSVVYQKALAAGLFYLGRVQSDSGQHVQSRRFFEQAVRHCQAALALDKEHPGLRSDLCEINIQLSDSFEKQGNYKQALRTFEEQIIVAENLVHDFPQVPAYSLLLLRIRLLVAEMLVKGGRYQEAEKLYRLAQESSKEQPGSVDDPSIDWKTWADLRLSLGSFLGKTRQYSAAERVYRQAVDVLQVLVDRSPEAHDFQHSLASGLDDLSIVLASTERLSEAVELSEKSLAIRQKLVDKFPKNAGYLRNLATGLGNRASHLMRMGKREEGEQATEKVLEACRKLIRDFGAEPDYLQLTSIFTYNKGISLHCRKRLSEAADSYEECRELRLTLVKKFPDNPEFRRQLAVTINNLAVVRRDSKQSAEACRLLQDAIDHYQVAVKIDPKFAAFREGLAQSVGNLASFRNQMGEHAVAAKAARELRRISPDWQGCSSAAYYLGESMQMAEKDTRLSQLDRKNQAQGYEQEARTLLHEAAKRASDNPASQDGLARLLIGRLAPRLRDPAQAIELAKLATERAPKNAAYWNTLGLTRYRAGDYQDALEAVENAAKLRAAGNGADLLLLAMAHWQLDHKEQARSFHERAMKWLQEHPMDWQVYTEQANELRDLRAEAIKLLNTAESRAPVKD
jgi:serine/threonine protein kinase